MNLGLETGNQLTQDSHTRYLQTMGTYLTYKNSGWNLDGAFYYQTGKNKDAESVSAFMASATAAYAFNKTWGMVVSFDYLSEMKKVVVNLRLLTLFMGRIINSMAAWIISTLLHSTKDLLPD